jgi:glycosyl hydrolase family 25
MTLYLLDVASYQGNLAVSDVVRAGFGGVNLKISHGLGVRSVHPDLAGWVTRARAAGLAISTFHFLDGSAGGADQARYAFRRLAQFGLLLGTAHQVDCESDASQAALRDYVTTMQELLGHPIAVYSGDWWWSPRGWDVSALTPYVWAAPNAGYLSGYPGDASAHWSAGWGGWPSLTVMQYAVGPLIYPDGSKGTIDVRKSAVRDPAAWTTLTGGTGMASWILVDSLIALRSEFNRVGPNRDKFTDGSIGDEAHSQSVSDHNPDETGNTGGVEDSDSINEVHAIDVDKSGPWLGGLTMEKIVQFLVARCKSGAEKRLRYIIYNQRIWSASTGWEQRAYTGPNPHTEHAHFSAVYGSGGGQDNPENVTKPYGLEGMIDVALDQSDKDFIANTVKSIYLATRQDDGVNWTSPAGQAFWNQGLPDGTDGNKRYAWAVLQRLGATLVAAQAADAARDAAVQSAVDGITNIVGQLLSLVQAGGGDVDSAAILAKLDEVKAASTAAAQQAAQGVLDRLQHAAEVEAAALES